MGIKVSAVQAAMLADRNERRVREWIRTGKLHAEKSGNTWLIDVDELARMPAVMIDSDRLALLEAEHARTPASILVRLDTLEREVLELRQRLSAMEGGGNPGADTPGPSSRLSSGSLEGEKE